jgi:diguanylate cyclase (GGDEF)-like protein
MNFDTSTLMIATSLTTALSAVVLLGMWAQHRRATALLWWFVANVLAAIGIAVLAIGLSEKNIHLTVAGTTLNGIALPLLWIGIRVFNRTPTSLPLVLLAVFGWVAADLAAGFMQFTSAFSFAGWCAWLLASAFELWRGRAERIPARWPLLAVFVLHASVCAGGVYDDLAGNMPRDALAPLDSWFGAIFFEGIVFAMASAVLMAMLCNERETQEYMRAARRDSLTGIANHGALLETSRRIYERCRRDGVPVSVIMFDLDHFKSINDAHGHRVGDDVLRAFVDTVRGLLRPTDLFGRYGGEEFTVILPGSTIETAQVIAERVRHAFAETHRFLNGQPLSATVSAGVAEAGADMTLDDTVDAADQAMYQAKKLGRNRVARAERQSPADGRDSIVRIA